MEPAIDRTSSPSQGIGLFAYDALAHAIVARHLQTELAEAEWIDWTEQPGAAARRLANLHFDQAPVKRKGKLVGYVARLELTASSGTSLAPHVHRLAPEILTSATASVLDVMEALLPGLPMTFVVDGHRVSGFVTVSDLNKHPARAYFYLLLADLEIVLARLVRGHYNNLEEAVALLDPRSQGVVRKRFSSDQKNNLETHLVAGMDLAHLLRIVGLTPILRAQFGADYEQIWWAWTDGFQSLRNSIMHPTLEFLGESRKLLDLVAAEARIRALLAASATL